MIFTKLNHIQLGLNFPEQNPLRHEPLPERHALLGPAQLVPRVSHNSTAVHLRVGSDRKLQSEAVGPVPERATAVTVVLVLAERRQLAGKR